MILSDAASTIKLQSAAILEHIGLNTVGTKSAILRVYNSVCDTVSSGNKPGKQGSLQLCWMCSVA